MEKSVMMFKLDPETHRRFKTACAAQGMSMQSWFLRAVNSFLEIEIQQIGIDKKKLHWSLYAPPVIVNEGESIKDAIRRVHPEADFEDPPPVSTSSDCSDSKSSC